jgi:hypothetical protein
MRLDHVGQGQGIKADKYPETWEEVGDEVSRLQGQNRCINLSLS